MKSTRKYILAVCVLALGFTVPSIRAEEGDRPKPAQEGKGDKAERGEMMKKKLGLTDDQAAQIKKIHEAEREQLKALKEKEGEPKEKRAEMRKIREATKAKVDAVLTAEQKAKMEEIRKNHEGGPGGDKPKGDKEKGQKGPPREEQ